MGFDGSTKSQLPQIEGVESFGESTANLETEDADPSSGSSAQNQTPPSAQTQNPPSATVAQRKLNCRYAANPNKWRFGCIDEYFDWDETSRALERRPEQ